MTRIVGQNYGWKRGEREEREDKRVKMAASVPKSFYFLLSIQILCLLY